MKNLKGVSLWMKVLVIAVAVLWCSPVFAGTIAESDGTLDPTGTLTTDGYDIRTEGGTITTSGGTIDTVGGNIRMLGGDLLTEGGDVYTSDVTAGGDVSAIGTVTGGTLTDGAGASMTGGIVTGDVVQDSGGASMAGGVVTGTSVTDGVATLNGGDLTGVDEITAATGNITTVNATDVNTTNVTATGLVEGSILQTDTGGASMIGDTVEAGLVEADTLQTSTGGVILNDGDIDADGTVTVTDAGFGETVITGGTLGVMNPNAGLIVDDTMAGMGYGGYSVICDDSGAIMDDGTNSVGVDGAGAFMTDGTASMSTSGGAATMTDGGTNNVTVDSSGASMTDGTASVSTSGGAANMSSGGGDVTVTDTQVSVTVDNGTATHGLIVGASDTVLSGGNTSTTLTLDDDGALLDNELNMDGNRITNVANGVHRYDAVNKGQLDEVAERAYQGIAAVAAMSAIPQPMSGHRFAIGIGGGTYKEEGAFALGGSANLTKNLRLTGSVGITSDSAVGAAGIGYSW
jgi:hypothetical protein